MKKYKSLKDLPGVPAGRVGEYDNGRLGYWFGNETFVSKIGVEESNPEWFAPVVEESLMEAAEKLLSEWSNSSVTDWAPLFVDLQRAIKREKKEAQNE